MRAWLQSHAFLAGPAGLVFLIAIGASLPLYAASGDLPDVRLPGWGAAVLAFVFVSLITIVGWGGRLIAGWLIKRIDDGFGSVNKRFDSFDARLRALDNKTFDHAIAIEGLKRESRKGNHP